jgi:hypothetical protein
VITGQFNSLILRRDILPNSLAKPLSLEYKVSDEDTAVFGRSFCDERVYGLEKTAGCGDSILHVVIC